MGILGKFGEPVAMWKMAMATDHGNWWTARISSAMFLIGELLSGLLGEDTKGAQEGCPLPKTL